MMLRLAKSGVKNFVVTMCWAAGTLMFLAGTFRLIVQHRENFAALALINYLIAALLVPPVRQYICEKLKIKLGALVTIFLVASLLVLHDLIPHEVIGLRGPFAKAIIEDMQLPDADEKTINRIQFLCRAAQRLVSDDKNFSVDLIEGCVAETLDNQGLKVPGKGYVPHYGKEELQQVKQVVNEVAILQHNIGAGDLHAFIELRAARPGTDMGEFLRLLYETNGVTIPPADAFPVNFYENEKVPLPQGGAFGVTWVGDHTLQYLISDNPTGLGKDEKNTRFVEVDISGSPIKITTLPAKDGADITIHNTSGTLQPDPFKGCAKLEQSDSYACVKKSSTPDPSAPDATNSRMNSWILQFRDGQGKVKKTFELPIQISPFNIKFDPYSDTYWMPLDSMHAEKIARFDRNFKKMWEETYPDKLWGGRFVSGISFGGHSFSYEEPFLYQVVRNGFVVGKTIEISNYDDLGNSHPKPATLYRRDVIFLVMKDGSTFKITEVPHLKEEYVSSDGRLFSISPDGCKVLFLQLDDRFKQPSQGISFTMYFGRSAKVGIVDVCHYFSRKH